MKPRTSETHPLQIATLNLASGARLGMTFCPGKCDPNAMTGAWQRNLDADLKAVAAWGATGLVTLMEEHELEMLRVPDLGYKTAALNMQWYHLPIRDVDVPAGPFLSGWPMVQTDVLNRLHAGGRVVVHCRGGLGRAGLVGALILVEAGIEADAAIREIRKARPGAIETTAQEKYVLDYRPKRFVDK